MIQLDTQSGVNALHRSVKPLRLTSVWLQVFVHTIRTALLQVDPEVPFVDSSPSNQIKTLDPYSKR